MVAVSEGIHYADGTFVSEAKTSATDGFGHAQLGGLASMLADDREAEAGRQGPRHRAVPAPALRRPICASKTDIEEAYLAGKAAVEAAV